MILQLINIVCGVLLIRDKISHPSVHDFLKHILPFESKIGLAAFALGIIGLIERFNFLHFGIPLGSSFPQALPAIFSGLLLASPYLREYSFLKKMIDAFAPHTTLIGIIAIASGLGSLLFGCISPIGCSAPF